MHDQDIPDFIQQFITNHLTREELQSLCSNLGFNYASLSGSDPTEKARTLLIECNKRHILPELLSHLKDNNSLLFAQAGIEITPNYIAILEGQLYSQKLRLSASAEIDTLLRIDSVKPKRPANKRRIAAWTVIVVVILGLVITILAQSGNAFAGYSTSGEDISLLFAAGGQLFGPIFFIVQSLVSFFALLASIAELSGWNIRELFSIPSVTSAAEAFPFFIINRYEELVDYILPDTMQPIIPDRSIRFAPRIAAQLDSAFSGNKYILIRGRSKTGKSREAVELIRRHLYSGATILLARNHVELRPPYQLPTTLPTRNLILYFDDIDRYCKDDKALKALHETIDFFADICHDPSELKVIATVRQEHEFWQELHFERSSLWSEFSLIELPPLRTEEANTLLTSLARRYQLDISPEVAEDIAYQNDGTFLNIIISLRAWLYEGLTQVGAEQATAFASNLKLSWKKRYERLLAQHKEVGPIFAAVNLLQERNISLRSSLIIELASEMNSSRSFHILDGQFARSRQKVELSSWLDRYRNWVLQYNGILYILLFLVPSFYFFSYLIVRFVPGDISMALLVILSTNLWAKWLLLLPLLLLAFPAIIIFLLQAYSKHQKKRVKRVLQQLMTAEIPLRGLELRPYESQFEGNGAVRNWHVSAFVDQYVNSVIQRYLAPRMAEFYWRKAKVMHTDGEFVSARAFAILALNLAPNHPTPPFVLGQLDYDQQAYEQALDHFNISVHLNSTTSSAIALERIAWCNYFLKLFDISEISANAALQKRKDFAGALWARGLARVEKGNLNGGLADCKQAIKSCQMIPPEVNHILNDDTCTVASEELTKQLRHLIAESSKFSENTPSTTRERFRIGVLNHSSRVLMALFVVGIVFLVYLVRTDNKYIARINQMTMSIYPNSPTLLLFRSISYFDLGEYNLALNDSNQAIELDPEFDFAYIIRGATFGKMAKFDRALTDINQALFLDSEYDDIFAYKARGDIYDEMGEYDLAVAAFNQALQFNSEDGHTYVVRGNTYLKMGENDLAFSDYNKALQLDPDDSFAYVFRGLLYEEIGESDLAIADYNSALKLDPDFGFAFELRGNIYRKMGENVLAISDFSHALQSDSESGYTYSIRGITYREIGEYDLAIADFTQALLVDPEYSFAYWNRGNVYHDMGEYDLAIADFTQALQLDPEDSLTYVFRGITYREMGQHDLAITDLTQALQLDPYDSFTYQTRANTYRAMGEYDHAIADFDQALLVDPEDGTAYAYRGNVYREIGEYDLAIADFTQALQLDPEDSLTYVFRGIVYREIGEFDVALIDFNQALLLKPEYVFVNYEIQQTAYQSIVKTGTDPRCNKRNNFVSTLVQQDPVSGSVTTSNCNIWKFESTQGQVSSISMVATKDNSLDPYLYLLTADGTLLTENDNGGEDLNAFIRFRLPQNGSYVVYTTGFGTSAGDYQITLTEEENCQITEIHFDQVVNRIADDDECSMWKFMGNEGQAVTLNLVAAEGSTLDGNLYLYGPNGTLIAKSDDEGKNWKSIIRLSLPWNGTYVIDAAGYNDSIGSFTLSLED